MTNPQHMDYKMLNIGIVKSKCKIHIIKHMEYEWLNVINKHI